MNPGLELDPHQVEGAALLARSPRFLLNWEPGVGKTPTAVRACVQVRAKNILVICPPIAQRVWREHFRDWSDLPPGRIQITPYSLVSTWGADVLHEAQHLTQTGFHWDVVVLDEIHNLKNPRARRTVGVYGENTDLQCSPIAGASFIWGLSGTPLLNHAGEYWTHLHALAPETLKFHAGTMSEDQFVERYCVTQNTPNGVRILGSRNTFELAQRVKPIVDRKRFKDVALGMPSLRITEHALPEDPTVSGPLRAQLEGVLDAMGMPDLAQLEDDELLAAVQSGSVSWSTVRRLIGQAKAPGVAELVCGMLEDDLDGKVILFAHHREVIAVLENLLRHYHPLIIHGGTPSKARDDAITCFQTDPRRRLIILAIETASEAVTLHASHNVVLAEFSPVPARNRQAIGRAYRRGQHHPVIARFVTMPGTLDARLMAIIARKTRDIASIIDHEGSSMVSVR
jgi:SWI/SNF-related matrix-associated actin-dependent regulator of chromatin subfamily A-like protein 1